MRCPITQLDIDNCDCIDCEASVWLYTPDPSLPDEFDSITIPLDANCYQLDIAL